MCYLCDRARINPDAENNLKKALFWEKLHEIFQITMEMVLGSAEEMGIDLNDLNTTDIDVHEEELEEKTTNHHCAVASNNYYKEVSNWFEEADDLLSAKGKELNENLQLGIDNDEGAELKDIIDIIHWYQYQIHIKIRRGLLGKFDPMGDDASPSASLWQPKDYPKDSDGSVKVALIGIDRSIAAWGKMLSFFPEKEDETLKILVALEQLRCHTEQEFPNARAYVRAGFDE
jgi:hypothetical protein